MSYLERILPREALVAVPTRERLDRKVYPLMPLEIVVAVEALRALIALERSIVWWCLVLRRMMRMLLRRVVIHVLQVRGMPTVEPERQAVRHPAVYQLHLAIWVLDV